jgi:cytosine/adenosine deaminase-related metal-dependent hydrolase
MKKLVLNGGAGRASVVVDGERVSAVGVGAAAGADGGARRFDCAGEGLAILPGAVNAHTHLYSGLAPLGMPAPAAPPRTFLEILERVWWRLDRALDEASLRASARLYVAEALLAGTTSLVDHHESPAFIEGSLDVLADAAAELGARMFVCYGATERNGGLDEARRGLGECARFARQNRRPLVRGLVGLHASFTASDATIREAGELARSLGTVVHVHVAEAPEDVEDARRRGHAGPFDRLVALDGLPRGSILAHGVHLGEAAVRAADAAGLWLVQNPRSNEGNRVGYASALHASTRVALGTDGWAADMPEEERALVRLASAAGDPEARAGGLARRLAGGRRLVGERAGVVLAPIAPGSAADLVVAEVDRAGAVTRARHVIVGGRVVVEDGRLAGADLDAIRAEAREEAARLWTRLRAI